MSADIVIAEIEAMPHVLSFEIGFRRLERIEVRCWTCRAMVRMPDNPVLSEVIYSRDVPDWDSSVQARLGLLHVVLKKLRGLAP